MARPLQLNPDRLFPAEPATRAVARRLYAAVKDLPIISPHGHTDPEWFAGDAPFANAAELLLAPDLYFDRINEALATRALFERFNIELLATTESPTDPLKHHKAMRASGWKGRVVTAYRPDPVVDPEHEDFPVEIERFGEMSGQDVHSWKGYLEAHRIRRAVFMEMGATSTDHGHPTAQTADLPDVDIHDLFRKVLGGVFTLAEAELFRAQMLTEMAKILRHRRLQRRHPRLPVDPGAPRRGPSRGRELPGPPGDRASHLRGGRGRDRGRPRLQPAQAGLQAE